jgi:5-methylcytosine-specific restriction enzyme B
MASQTNNRDITPILSSARSWIDRCLIEDGSVLSGEALWTQSLVEEVRQAFVEHPDSGKDDFITKLKRQMKLASLPAQHLMAEMLWALLLFPSNSKPSTKRKQVREIWALSGQQLAEDHSLLGDDVLVGIGSGGPGFNNHRWREMVFLILLAGDLKHKPTSERQRVFSDYDAFMEWIETVPQTGHRQFRHMLRYFAFPARVERMSSNRDRKVILDAFGVAATKEMKNWSDRQLDDALFALRRTLQTENPSVAVLDFYEPPLRSRWKSDEDPEDDDADADDEVISPPPSARPVNLILYGPPGTGKTHWLRQKFAHYTEMPSAVDGGAWIQELLSIYGWRSVIAATLAEIGHPARVPEIRQHRWVDAKGKQRGRIASSIQATLWAYLQGHTPETVTTVKYASRRPPFIFSKQESGEWELVSDWRELDEDSAELTRLLEAGPNTAREAIRRYRLVTFHPSFSYEEFVRGIRPVATTDDGITQFRMVDGIFKRICDEAQANPCETLCVIH